MALPANALPAARAVGPPRAEPVSAAQRRHRRAFLATLAFGALLLASVFVSASLGPARIPLHVGAGVALEAVGLPTAWAREASPTQQQVVRAIRLPRILAAALVGATLALVGATMQALFRNPMADPGIVGVSAGGSLGAVLAIGSGAAALHWIVLPGAAFLGALVAASAVFLFSLRHGRSQTATLLLGGIAVTYLCSAATSAIISFTYDRDTLREMLFWLLGGFDNRAWEHVQVLAPVTLLGGALLLLNARNLNLLLLGEEDAQSLGLPVQRVRLLLLAASALMTGVAVAISGLVGFVGLVVPHVVRLIVGPDHRLLLPLSALGGAWFLLAADTAARTLIQPTELRVGIVTALVGSPFFLYLLARQRAALRSL